MKYYLNLNKQSNGDYEIHNEECIFYNMYKSDGNFYYLGYHETEQGALSEAKSVYPNISKINGCAFCCKKIHTS